MKTPTESSSKTIRYASVLILCFLGFSIGHADDMVEPTELCTRFVTEPEIQSCQTRIQKLSPDWYLAAICRNQNEHEGFWSCIELSKNHSFDPKKLQVCAGAEMKDDERLGCIKKLTQAGKISEPKRESRRDRPIPVRSAIREH